MDKSTQTVIFGILVVLGVIFAAKFGKDVVDNLGHTTNISATNSHQPLILLKLTQLHSNLMKMNFFTALDRLIL
jgi:hypothetical protein